MWVLHRKPKHDLGKKVGNLVADRNDPEAIKAALAGQKFDVVFDNVYDWERGTTAAHVEATARACGNRLHRYVFMSSVAAYGDGLNHHEGDALAPDDHPDLYVRNKAMSERALFRLHQRNRPAGRDAASAVHLRSGQSLLSRSVFLGPPARRTAPSFCPATDGV